VACLRTSGLTRPESRVRCCFLLPSAAMPRATSERFARAHQPPTKSKPSKNNGEPSSSSVRNPIFNTERFGQHILKNPSIAQEYVAFSGWFRMLSKAEARPELSRKSAFFFITFYFPLSFDM
jgi:hypothetical protein